MYVCMHVNRSAHKEQRYNSVEKAIYGYDDFY